MSSLLAFIESVSFEKKDAKWVEDILGVFARSQCEVSFQCGLLEHVAHVLSQDVTCLGLLAYEDFEWQDADGQKLPPGKRAFAKVCLTFHFVLL